MARLYKCPIQLEQSFKDIVFHQIRQGDLQFRFSLHGTLDGEGGAFVAGPVAAGDAFFDIPMVFSE